MKILFAIIKRAVNAGTDLVYAQLFGGSALARKRGVLIGKDCRIYIRNFGTEPFLISIGDRVTITSGVRVLTHDGSTWLIRECGQRYQRYAPVVIGDDVFIGVNSIIMPGVTIGSRVIVGAGSIVTRDVANNSVVAGNPAKLITTYEEYAAKIKRTCPNDTQLEHYSDYRKKVAGAIQIAREKSAGSPT